MPLGRVHNVNPDVRTYPPYRTLRRYQMLRIRSAWIGIILDSQIRIRIRVKSRIQIRIKVISDKTRIKVKSRIRTRIEAKRGIRIHVDRMRIWNTEDICIGTKLRMRCAFVVSTPLAVRCSEFNSSILGCRRIPLFCLLFPKFTFQLKQHSRGVWKVSSFVLSLIM